MIRMKQSFSCFFYISLIVLLFLNLSPYDGDEIYDILQMKTTKIWRLSSCHKVIKGSKVLWVKKNFYKRERDIKTKTIKKFLIYFIHKPAVNQKQFTKKNIIIHQLSRNWVLLLEKTLICDTTNVKNISK